MRSILHAAGHVGASQAQVARRRSLTPRGLHRTLGAGPTLTVPRLARSLPVIDASAVVSARSVRGIH